MFFAKIAQELFLIKILIAANALFEAILKIILFGTKTAA
jgi:hypothetical protein